MLVVQRFLLVVLLVPFIVCSKGLFDSSDLPMKGKRKPNGHQERRGKQTFRRSIHEREKDYSQFSMSLVTLKVTLS
ncbi:hypothetical protein GVanDAA620_24940 [Enterococcus faecium]|nr:hypothetical protein GVanDAA620_24670 [Enterococcus faecium]BCZ34604.1 hypothetical protein GVanDAA620_24940 [Enterococcus faecium]